MSKKKPVESLAEEEVQDICREIGLPVTGVQCEKATR